MRPKIREDAREHRQDGWSFSCHKERCTAKVGTLAVTDGHRPRRRRSPARTRRTLRGYPVAPALSGARSVIMPPVAAHRAASADLGEQTFSRVSDLWALLEPGEEPASAETATGGGSAPIIVGRKPGRPVQCRAAGCTPGRDDVLVPDMWRHAGRADSGRRSARQRVRAGRGHEPLRHPVVDVMYPSSNRPVSSSTDALSEVLQIRAAFAASATAPSRELCASIRLSPGSS